MYRHGLLLALIIFAATALVYAQEDKPPVAEQDVVEPITIEKGSIDPPVFGPLTGVWTEVEVEAQRVQDPTLTENHAADLCRDAPQLPLATFGNAGDISTVNDMTNNPNDPILSCMHGFPSNPRGYRTVWYKFRAPVSGHLTVSTGFDPSNFEDSYDTVVALYRSVDGGCGTLSQLACDDDTEGFLSELSYFVIEGAMYYIEVADWHLGSQAADTLRLAVVLEEGDTYWDKVDTLWEEARSRHMVVTDGRYIYVIGGEKVVSPFPTRDGSLRRFDPFTGEWLSLWPIEGDAYSRTSAAYLNGRIYIPSGYIGNDDIYADTHWTYDIATNQWFASAEAPWPNGQAYAWHQTAAVPALNGYFVTGGLLSGNPDPTYPSTAEPTANVLFYSPGASGGGGFWDQRVDMNQARYAHVADYLGGPLGHRVCVAGGLSKDTTDPNLAVVLGTAECLNIATGSWEPIAPLNFPRFSAGSAVGPDGRWYVFGGINSRLQTVPHTEVYDPISNSWRVLDSRYSLRRPSRAWPRGVFIGETLWVFGGEEVPGNEVIPLIEKLEMPGGTMWLPILNGAAATGIEPNDVFDQALPLGLFDTIEGDFSTHDDFFDFYRFQVTEMVPHTVHVTSIPNKRNYDVYVYNANKFLVGDSQNIGNLDEHATTHPLTPGTYYAMVLRSFGTPTTDTYEISITR